jgi:hypothetical protein
LSIDVAHNEIGGSDGCVSQMISLLLQVEGPYHMVAISDPVEFIHGKLSDADSIITHSD